MFKRALNLVAQSLLTGVVNTTKPVNIACKLTLETTAAVAAGCNVAKDATRRKLVPTHKLAQGEPLTFNAAIVDIHNVRYSEMRYLDRRDTFAEYCTYNNIPSKADIMNSFKKPVAAATDLKNTFIGKPIATDPGDVFISAPVV